MKIVGIMLLTALVASPVQAGDEVDAVVDELTGSGELAARDVERFEQQLRTRLGDGEAVCSGEEEAACQQQLRNQVRACHRVGKKTGQVESAEDAARVAAAVMTMANGGGDVEQAGELVRAQLQHKWKAEQVGETAQQMKQLRHRWRHQAMKVAGVCAGDDSCTPEAAQLAVRAMKAASQRADLDPRRVARQVRAALAEETRKQGSGEQLQVRLQKRLRLKGEGGTEATVGEGEQYRHRYRHQMDGEGRRGGKFGGQASSGEGVGAGPGTKPRGRR